MGEEVEGHLQGIPGGGAHLLGIVEALAHGHGGRTEQAVVQRADGGGGVGLRRGALLPGEPLGELDDELTVGHENGGGNDVEHGMAQRDAEGINGHVVDGQGGKWRENEVDRQNNQRAQEVDEGVHDGHALGAGVGTTQEITAVMHVPMF